MLQLVLSSPGLVLAWIGALVDVVHQPGKGAGVKCFGHGVSVLLGFCMLQGDMCDVATDVDLSLQQTSKELLSSEAQQCGQGLQHLLVTSRQLTVFPIDVCKLREKRVR